jgi:hypothetical protein
MSDPHDHDAGPDPIDAAYERAEAMLADEAARAERRARVLAVVAQDPPAAAETPIRRGRRAWGRGGWLVAAGVAGLGLFLAVQTYRPPIVAPPPGPTARPGAASPASPSAAAPAPPPQTTAPATIAKPPGAAAVPPVDQPARSKREALAPPGRAAAATSQPAAQPSELVVTAERRSQSLQRVPLAVSPAAPAPPPPPPPPPPPAPPPAAIAAPRPAPPASQDQAADSVSEEVVSGRARDAAAPRGGMAAKAAPVTAMTGPAAPDPAARLRAAAAAGRTGELAKLLGQGVPVDAADDAGDTALMKSVRADHPAAAALLRRHGASLDRTNQAGESARDLAAGKGDPALNRAIGIVP